MMDLKEHGYEKVAEKTVENLVIRKGRCDLAVITLADGVELKRGQVLFEGTDGKVTATAAAGKARAILAENVTGTSAGEVTAEVFYAGIFNGNGITGTLSAADIDALRARDIYVETPAT